MLLKNESELVQVNLVADHIQVKIKQLNDFSTTHDYSIPMAEKVIGAMQRLVNESKGIKFTSGEQVKLMKWEDAIKTKFYDKHYRTVCDLQKSKWFENAEIMQENLDIQYSEKEWEVYTESGCEYFIIPEELLIKVE